MQKKIRTTTRTQLIEDELQKLPKSLRHVYLLGHKDRIDLSALKSFVKSVDSNQTGNPSDIPKRWKNMLAGLTQAEYFKRMRNWGIDLPKNPAQWDLYFTSTMKLLPEAFNLKPPWDKVEVDKLMSQGLMTVPQAAEFLSIGKSKLYEWMNKGVLPYVMFGTDTTRKQRRIPRVVLMIFAEKMLGDES